eukprot:gene2095-3050_t
MLASFAILSLQGVRAGATGSLRGQLDAGAPPPCKGGLCAGMAHYPVGTGVHFYSEFDVPGLPAKVDGITDFIYFNIFFGNPKGGDGKMNQFVPQLMLGNPLCNSTGPPDYKPLWHHQDTWVIGSQYFFEVFNETANRTEGHAATGDLVKVSKGEIVYTQFEVSVDWMWTLTMGVKGQPDRVSTVVAHKPYMGILPDSQTKSWSEAQDTYSHAFVNSCWELYGMRDRDHYPSSGSHYEMVTKTDSPNSIQWDTHWVENEKPDCPGCPNSTITERHNETTQ